MPQWTGSRYNTTWLTLLIGYRASDRAWTAEKASVWCWWNGQHGREPQPLQHSLCNVSFIGKCASSVQLWFLTWDAADNTNLIWILSGSCPLCCLWADLFCLWKVVAWACCHGSHPFSCSFGCCGKDWNLVAFIMNLKSRHLPRGTMLASCSIFLLSRVLGFEHCLIFVDATLLPLITYWIRTQDVVWFWLVDPFLYVTNSTPH